MVLCRLASREAELKDAHQKLAIAHSAADDQDLKLVALKQKLKLTEDDYKEQVDLLAQRVQVSQSFHIVPFIARFLFLAHNHLN